MGVSYTKEEEEEVEIRTMYGNGAHLKEAIERSVCE